MSGSVTHNSPDWHSRNGRLWNLAPAQSSDHCGLMPANLITLAHFSVSSARCLPNAAVDFVIVNHNDLPSKSEVAQTTKNYGVTIPIVEDGYGSSAISKLYMSGLYLPSYFIVKPSGEVCGDTPLQQQWSAAEPLHGFKSTDELLSLLLGCGAPSPGSTVFEVPWIDFSWVLSHPAPYAFTGMPPIPKGPDTYAYAGPPPVPKGHAGLSLMSREVVRALAIHDTASRLTQHEARTAIRSAALKAAAASLRRMESLAALEAEIEPRPPHAVTRVRDGKKKARKSR
jgi:hypothetical protein